MVEKIKKTKAPAKAKSSEPKDETAVKVAKTATVVAALKPRAKASEAVEVTENALSTNATRLHAVPAKVAIKKEETVAATPSREQIAQLAHRFWRERGGQHGGHEQDWFRAERELRGMAS